MTELTTENLTAELPRELYIIVMYYEPPEDRVGPMIIPFPPVGFGLPVFGERELAEKFVASLSCDVSCIIKVITLESFIAVGELPIDLAKEHDTENEYFYMVDPRPWDEWKGIEDMGFLVPMRDVAEALRDELGAN